MTFLLSSEDSSRIGSKSLKSESSSKWLLSSIQSGNLFEWNYETISIHLNSTPNYLQQNMHAFFHDTIHSLIILIILIHKTNTKRFCKFNNWFLKEKN